MITALENQRLEIQARLDAEKTAEDRNRMGQYATPSALALSVLEQAKRLLPKNAKVRFLDPALGSGAFYAALLRTFPASRIQHAQAFEVDPHYGKPAEALWAGHGLHLTLGDFTKAEAQPTTNLVICNPPYVRHHHLSQDDKKRLIEKTLVVSGRRLSGLAGLYCHFLLQSVAWMEPGAIGGWLIPSEFLGVNYGKEVKDFLLSRVSVLHIHRFDPNDVQFVDAVVSSAVLWFRNAPPKPGHRVRFTYGGGLADPHKEMSVASADLAHETKWTRFPLQDVRVTSTTIKVGDLFRIQRGLATGDNGFFILDEAKARQRGLPQKALRPILPSPRYVNADIIEADAQGIPINTRRLFLLDPGMNPEEIVERHPALAAYLEEGRANGLDQRYLCRNRQRWYDQEKREPAPIVCAYMGRGEKGRPFRFIRNKSGATVANAYLTMYPTPELKARLIREPGLLDALWQQLSKIRAEDLLGEGRVYGGGLCKLEPKELARVPLGVA